jgi:hypothetical protein
MGKMVGSLLGVVSLSVDCSAVSRFTTVALQNDQPLANYFLQDACGGGCIFVCFHFIFLCEKESGY